MQSENADCSLLINETVSTIRGELLSLAERVRATYFNPLFHSTALPGRVVSGPFEGHTDLVTSVSFSPDGKRIVSGSHDMTIRVWDVQTGDMVSGPFEGHTYSVISVSFLPDGKHIVSGSYDKTICVWDAQTEGVVSRPFEGLFQDAIHFVGRHQADSIYIPNFDVPATSEIIIEDEAFEAQSVTVWPKSGTTPR